VNEKDVLLVLKVIPRQELRWLREEAKYMSVPSPYIVFLPLSLTNAMSHKCDSCVKPHDIIIVCHGAKSIS